MLDTLVIAVEYEKNFSHSWLDGVGEIRDATPTHLTDLDNFEPNLVQIWVCSANATKEVVDNMTLNFPGKEIKVFNLSEIHIRPPGPIISKNVTKDGVLPF